MSTVVTAFGNYVKGQLDHDLNGRYDLPTYNTGQDIFTNWISNYKGNAIFSSGLISEVAFQDCAFIEYKFGITQDYLICATNAQFQFLAYDTNGNFGWVLSGGTPLQVVTPYTLADAKTISQKGSYTQNSDVMYLANRSYPPYRLTRTASNAFTMFKASVHDAFTPSVGGSAKTIQNIFNTPVAGTTATQLNINGHGYTVNEQIFINSTSIPQWDGYAAAIIQVVDANNVIVSVDSSSFPTYTTGAGTTNLVTGGDWPGCVCFYKGRLWYGSTPSKLTTLYMSRIASYDDFTSADSPVTDASPFTFTCTDIVQQIEWIFPGDNSLIVGSTDGIIAVNGGTVNTAITPSTVQANISSAEPTNGFYPLKKDGLIFYVGRASRNIYSFKYDILTEAFLSSDANLEAYDVTRGNISKIRYRHDRNNLIYSLRGDGNLVSLVFQEKENINGWHVRNTQGTFSDVAVMGDNLGNPQLFSLVNRNGTFYVERQADYVEFKKLQDFWTPSTDSTDQAQNQDIDQEAYLRYVSEQLRGCNYLDNSISFQDYRTSTITFTATGTDPNYGNEPSGTLVSTASDFTSADVGKHIAYKTATGYESGRYIITAYTNATTVSVTVLQTPKIDSAGPVSTNLYVWSSWYKSFVTVSGLSQYNGKQVGLVTDGGFLDAVTVSGGTITLPNQTTSIVIGLQYTGIMKSMSLGFSVQGKNTQVTYKIVSKFSLRFVSSMGVRAGTSLYDLTDVQLRTTPNLNYLPPAPLDGTYDVEITDDSEEDKYVYVVQSDPLPAILTNNAVEANYSVQ